MLNLYIACISLIKIFSFVNMFLHVVFALSAIIRHDRLSTVYNYGEENIFKSDLFFFIFLFLVFFPVLSVKSTFIFAEKVLKAILLLFTLVSIPCFTTAESMPGSVITTIAEVSLLLITVWIFFVDLQEASARRVINPANNILFIPW